MNISGDPFEKGEISLAKGVSYGADAYDHTPVPVRKRTRMATIVQAEGVVAEVMQASGGTGKAWNREAIVSAYRSILVDVDSLKTAINSKNQVAARVALAKLRKDSEALDKLVK